MAHHAVKARLSFLATSAQLYSSIAPATSAHLMLECKTIATDNDLLFKENSSQRSCNACGTILFPGLTLQTFITDSGRSTKPPSKPRREGHPVRKEAQKLIISKCLVCHRSVKTALGARTRPNFQEVKSGTATSESFCHAQAEVKTDAPRQEPQSRPTANFHSKKRAKARRQGGLQAMLEGSKAKQIPSSDFGLDLMDLMKKI